MEMVLIIVLAAGAMYLMSRSSRKRQKEAVSFRDNLQIGQEVMTGSGYFGTIVAVDDDAITLESTPGNTSRWLRAAIAKLVEAPVVDDSVDGQGDASAAVADKQAFTIPDDISGLIEKPSADTPGSSKPSLEKPHLDTPTSDDSDK